MNKEIGLDWFFENIKSHFEHNGDLLEAVTMSYDIAKIKDKLRDKGLIMATYIDIKMQGCKLPYGMEYLAKLDKVTNDAEKYYFRMNDKTIKMKKQSAVQWLVEQVNSDCLNSAFIRPELVEKANAMFEEQIKDAWNSCGESIITEEFDNAQQYYNETYKSE